MALKLDYPSNPFGVPAPESYWEVVGFAFDNSTLTATLTFDGWASVQARTDGKRPIGRQQFTVTQQEFLQLAQVIGPAIVPTFYAQAVQQPFFAGATLVPAV